MVKGTGWWGGVVLSVGAQSSYSVSLWSENPKFGLGTQDEGLWTQS